MRTDGNGRHPDMVFEFLARYRWEREIKSYLDLCMEFQHKGEDLEPLIKTGRYIISETDSLIPLEILYRLLLTKYPDLLIDFSISDDGDSGDDGGPLNIHPSDVKPRTLKEKMLAEGYSVAVMYQ